MELNWTTFALEVINFLVLVWLLKLFLYKPVKDSIKRRQRWIEEQLQHAEDVQNRAEALRKQYESRLVDWEGERQGARKKLHQEIELERMRLKEKLQLELDAERKKNEVLAARQADELKRQCEVRALELGARFSSRLLSSVASEELQGKLIKLLMSELQQLPVDQEKALLAMTRDIPVQITSAFPLNKTEKQSLQNYLESLLPHCPPSNFATDQTLIAGLRVTVGPWVIHANLHDELKTFTTLVHEK